MVAEIENLVEKFLQNYNSETTIATYKQVLKKFNEKMKKPLDQITPSDVKRYIKYIVNKYGKISRTSKLHQTVLSYFFKTIGRKDLEATSYHSRRIPNPDPITHITLPERQPISSENLVSDQEYKKLLDATEYARDEITLRLLWDTGARLNEIVEIKVEDVNFADGLIRVEGKGRMGRGKKPRLVPATKETLDLIKEYITKKDLKLKNYLIGVQEFSIYLMLLKLCKKAGIRKLHPHMFRHTFCTRCADAGMPILTLAAMSGHQDIKIIQQIYYHATPKTLLEQYKKAFGD